MNHKALPHHKALPQSVLNLCALHSLLPRPGSVLGCWEICRISDDKWIVTLWPQYAEQDMLNLILHAHNKERMES